MLEYLAHGETCWQPMFGSSNHRYSNFGVFFTVLVVSTISGNERLVKKAKISRFIGRGGFDGCSTFNIELLADMWLSWGFIMSFTYASVH